MDTGLKDVRNIIDSEKGFVLVVAVLMLAVLTAIGIAALRTSDTELGIASNEKQHIDEFYSVEGALIDRLENFSAWLDTDFLTAGETVAFYTADVDIDSDATNDGSVEIRCIEDTGTPVDGLRDAANDLPLLSHVGPPPRRSGYSLKYFEIRRYALTGTSTTENTLIQFGVWKVFNKE